MKNRFLIQLTNSKTFVLLFFASLFLVGCGDKQTDKSSTPTSGTLVIYSSPAIYPVVQAGADEFNRLYREANVNVVSLNSRAIIDSVINRKVDVGYFDRNVTEAESLAISNSRKHLYGFLLGSTVATWIVNPENPIITIDSLQAWEILTGKTTSWRNIGWINQPINIYLPPLGDGAWNELTNFFHGSLKQLKANFWPNDSLIIEQVSKDPYALGFIGRQIFNGKVKKLRWVNPLLEDPVPANIGALQEGKYPFKIRLYYFTIGDKTDLASGFLSFMASNAGQRLISDNGFLPEMVPVRAVTLTGSGNK